MRQAIHIRFCLVLKNKISEKSYLTQLYDISESPERDVKLTFSYVLCLLCIVFHVTIMLYKMRLASTDKLRTKLT